MPQFEFKLRHYFKSAFNIRCRNNRKKQRVTHLIFKTKPYQHQLAAFERFKDETYGAIFFEQRLGKAKTTLDIAAHKYRTKNIDSLLLISPNGVHRQWALDAIPEHLPEDVRGEVVLWNTSKIKQKGIRQQLKDLLNYTEGLRILSINIDAVNTSEFKAYANAFFRGHKVMSVVDESSDLSNDKSKRTEAAVKIRKASRFRFILDGTPVAAGPMGLYGQCEFLSPSALGFESFMAFKANYAELVKKDFGERDKKCPDCLGVGHKQGVSCERCWGSGYVGRHRVQVIATHVNEKGETVRHYRNLDELKEKLDKFSMRLTRAECYDLPPKIYQKLYFELTSQQRRHYENLREKYVTELKNGNSVTAAMVLVRYLRLQQVASGFLPSEAELLTCSACHGQDDFCQVCAGVGLVEAPVSKNIEVIDGGNPRLDLLIDQVTKLPGQGVVWAHFDYDIDTVVSALRGLDKRVVQYDGRVSDSAKTEAVRAFQGGEADVFVAKPRSAGRGHDLDQANWTVYYSHGFSLRMRLQSEDRAQSLRKKQSVLYLDLVGTDTVDERIVTALRTGKQLSDIIIGDKAEEWL